jgi:hypothetical protein
MEYLFYSKFSTSGPFFAFPLNHGQERSVILRLPKIFYLSVLLSMILSLSFRDDRRSADQPVVWGEDRPEPPRYLPQR